MKKILLLMSLAFVFAGALHAEVIKGRIKTMSSQAGTLQISIKDKGAAVVRVGPDTVYEGASGFKELGPPDLLEVEQSPGKFATRIKKIVFGLPAGVEVSIEDLLKIMIGSQPYYLFDARPAKHFGAAHLPGALSAFPENEGFLSQLPEDKNTLLVFYCGGPTCPYTNKAVEKAQQAGYTQLKGFQAGLPGWKKAKLPFHTESDWLAENLNTQHVVLDVRDGSASGQSHIKDAVAMPVMDLQAMTQKFIQAQTAAELPGVTDQRASIIVYADSHTSKEALLAYKELRDWGYNGTTVLYHGFTGWQAAGLPTASGPAATKIVYEKKLAPGAIAPDEFIALDNSREGVVFVDVRSEKETVKGALNDARYIPLENLQDAAANLPKDKEVIIYCANGIRAEMGREILDRLGFKTRFLNETIQINKDGSYKL